MLKKPLLRQQSKKFLLQKICIYIKFHIKIESFFSGFYENRGKSKKNGIYLLHLLPILITYRHYSNLFIYLIIVSIAGRPCNKFS